jgi:septal ring-binding cell division protein DamX
MALFIANIVGCTTTTKLVKTGAPVDQAAQFEKAKTAFDQQDYEHSALLLKPLAEQGHEEAQYALGYMWRKGLGVPQNDKLAIQWLSLAAAQGNKKATKALRHLSQPEEDATDKNEQAISAPTLAPEEITEAKMAAKEEPQASETPETATPHLPDTLAKEVLQSEPTETPEAITHAITTETSITLSVDEQWIMSQPDESYTIQLIATSNEAALQRFISENNLHDSAVYYQTRKNGGNWYTLIQGSFKSSTLARSAIRKLASSLQTAKPWIKPIADIQEVLAAR